MNRKSLAMRALGTILLIGVILMLVKALLSAWTLTQGMGAELETYRFVAALQLCQDLLTAAVGFCLYEIVAAYYKGKASFRVWIPALRSLAWAYCGAAAVLSFANYYAMPWGHPFRGSLFHVLHQVTAAFSSLPPAIALLLLADLLGECLNLREESALTV